MSTTKKKSWKEKLHNNQQPRIEIPEKAFAGIEAGQRMLIPTPLLIDAYIKQIPAGKKVEVSTLRNDLAIEHGAEVTCPLTTGIFLRIVAEAAYEDHLQGQPLKATTPFWRVIDAKSTTAKKLSFGTGFLQAQQKEEGI